MTDTKTRATFVIAAVPNQESDTEPHNGELWDGWTVTVPAEESEWAFKVPWECQGLTSTGLAASLRREGLDADDGFGESGPACVYVAAERAEIVAALERIAAAMAAAGR